MQARFLDGTEPAWKSKSTSRGTLADWMTSPSNPYFARAAVNRIWAYFFGTGLVEPVDEMVGGDRQPSHPELLDLLAREFAAHHVRPQVPDPRHHGDAGLPADQRRHAQEPGRSARCSRACRCAV